MDKLLTEQEVRSKINCYLGYCMPTKHECLYEVSRSDDREVDMIMELFESQKKAHADQILTLFKESLPKPDFTMDKVLENPSWAEMRLQSYNHGKNATIEEVTQLLEEGLKHG